MEIKYFFQNFKLNSQNKKFIEDKIKKLERFSEKIWEAKIDLSYRPTRKKEQTIRLEINLRMPNKILRAEERDKDLLNVIEKVEKKLKGQLRKYRTFGEKKKRETQKIIDKIKRG
ncbi:MAG: ribosome-associated translation inhibitor RaiA [Patescibacteria group bacterium]|jgi:putative sigma-54 modulation protein|nr:ribosome-associated translation inhibitor RaiA [Patescibacteria group bacterium]MDD5172982.1 ribosome-associated translation inhibitor RaiA [Patescibacteria group bacterium]